MVEDGIVQLAMAACDSVVLTRIVAEAAEVAVAVVGFVDEAVESNVVEIVETAVVVMAERVEH